MPAPAQSRPTAPAAAAPLLDLLLHQPPLTTFEGLRRLRQWLPLLRRTFAEFSQPERRLIGEQLSSGPTAAAATGGRWDLETAGPALGAVARLLGWRADA